MEQKDQARCDRPDCGNGNKLSENEDKKSSPANNPGRGKGQGGGVGRRDGSGGGKGRGGGGCGGRRNQK